MSKFSKGGKKNLPAISTSSLPDIVFMLLFFFMVATKMKEVTLKVMVRKPHVVEATKLENRSLVSNIYIGKPIQKYIERYGNQPRIQLDDAFANLSDVGPYVQERIALIVEGERPKHTTSLKIDKEAKMGIVTDVKQALRDVDALKINYAAVRSGRIDEE